MKYRGSTVFGIIVFMALILLNARPLFSFGFSSDDKDTVNLQTFVVSDFGDDTDKELKMIWKANFSRFAKPKDPTQVMSEPDPEACNIKYVEAKPLGLPNLVDAKQKYALGVKAQFLKKSYNWIELIPYTSDSGFSGSAPDPNAQGTAHPLELIGVIKSLDMWVWGGNYNYWIEFYLQDFKGYLHRLSAGDIAFVGWKNMRTKIPDYIPQAEHHVPFMKPLKLEMIKLWSYPTERVDQFYAYFDYMQVQTDVYQERFNGDDLAVQKW